MCNALKVDVTIPKGRRSSNLDDVCGVEEVNADEATGVGEYGGHLKE